MNRINFELVMDRLQELKDRNFQARVWMSSGPPEVSSLTEAIEQLFTDSGLGDALDEGETGLAENAVAVFAELDEQLKRIDLGRSPDVIINDPAMVRVRELAGIALSLVMAAREDCGDEKTSAS